LDVIARPLVEFTINKAGLWRGGYIVVGLIGVAITVLLALNRHRFRTIVVEPTSSKRGVSALATLRLPQVWMGILLFSLSPESKPHGTVDIQPVHGSTRGSIRVPPDSG
jgi:hypothetical protein